MSQVIAQLKNYRQSPRKVRLVAEYVKGKDIKNAISKLSLLPKRASDPVKKLILSAVANAKDLGYKEDSLVVKNLTVDKGTVLMRRMERARGKAFPIRKRTSHLRVTLESSESPKEIKTEEKKEKTKKVVENKAEKKETKPKAKRTIKQKETK